MSVIFLLFSHRLTEQQEMGLEEELGVTHIETLPEDLETIWASIPPKIKSLQSILLPFKKYLKTHASKGDYVLLQGDFGATFHLVDWCNQQGLIPVYATSERVHQEQKLPGGAISIQKTFKHVMFRKYEFNSFGK